MTELNQNPMNTNQRSKAPLVLFIVCILVLVVVGIYFAYANSLNKTADVAQLNGVNNVVKDDTVKDNTAADTDESKTTDNPIPADWKEYTLTGCGIKIYLPPGWSFNVGTSADDYYSMISNSPERSNEINKEGYSSLTINCYNSIKDFVNSSSSAQSISTMPTSLEEALNMKNPYSDVFYNIFDFASKPQEITLNGKKGFQGLQGGFGVTLNRFFEYNGKIVEIVTDNFDQNTLKLDDIDQQIQDLIKFST